MSMTRHTPLRVGMTVAMPGRATPGRRPMTRVAAAVTAPVLPAETKASASSSRTRRAPTTIDDAVLRRTACAGASSMEIVSGACTTRTGRSRPPARSISRAIASSGPTQMISLPPS